MKIKTKLIIAFCIIIFVPILLATATVVGFCNFQAHAIEETYGIKTVSYTHLDVYKRQSQILCISITLNKRNLQY